MSDMKSNDRAQSAMRQQNNNNLQSSGANPT
jgi:hypothetical protein